MYSVFNGEELLKSSILSIKESVDYIGVMYQTKSNYGNTNDNLNKEIDKLLKEGLIDEAIEYHPLEVEDKMMSGTFNILKKRNMALDRCRELGCTHFLSLDTDEFYKKEEFARAVEIVKKHDLDSCFCEMKVYFKYPQCELTPDWRGYYVPFLYKIREGISHKFFDDWDENIFVDNCRRMEIGKSYIFSRNELEMHHYSYVRKDIRSKYVNTSFIEMLKKEGVDEMENSFKDYKKGEVAKFLFSNGFQTSKVKLVDNYFNIKL